MSMRPHKLTVIGAGITSPKDLPQTPLGVLSIHFEGGQCRVACPFCYLGRREAPPESGPPGLDMKVVREALGLLRYDEVAIALSEPVEAVLPALSEIARIARERGCRVALTTTLAVAASLPRDALCGIDRLSLSIDPWKGPVTAENVAAALSVIGARCDAEVVLIVTLSTRRFALKLLSGLLGELLALPAVDRVALNALKPPPPWCDRAFWLRALSRLGPLLREQLDRRLFLDCYVAARILQIGGCPARPDLSPPSAGPGVAFRGCVYQPAPDFIAETGQGLASRLLGFSPPTACPFPIN